MADFKGLVTLTLNQVILHTVVAIITVSLTQPSTSMVSSCLPAGTRKATYNKHDSSDIKVNK